MHRLIDMSKDLMSKNISNNAVVLVFLKNLSKKYIFRNNRNNTLLARCLISYNLNLIQNMSYPSYPRVFFKCFKPDIVLCVLALLNLYPKLGCKTCLGCGVVKYIHNQHYLTLVAMEDGDILDASWMNLVGSFDDQVMRLFSYVRLTRDEVEELRCLFSDVENMLQMQWPGCEVIPFGSIITGMGIRTSDVDCYVHIPESNKPQPRKCVTIARNILRKKSYIFANLFSIASAKVPIVKFFHVPTSRNCDVSFQSPNGVRNSKLISYLLHLDRRAKDLAILVKYWSKVHNLTGTNLMPNYALTLLVIFYLQHMQILPPVHQLQDGTPLMVEGWNTEFTEHFHVTGNEYSLYNILGGFFTYYANFNFDENIISPYLGYPIFRDIFMKHSDVPVEFQLYKDNLLTKTCKPLKLNTPMCVQDPFDHSRNCTVAVFPKLAFKIYDYFRFAAKLYGERSPDRFLCGILTRQAYANMAPTKGNKNNKFKTQNKIQKPHRPNEKFKKVKNTLHVMYAQMQNKF